MPNSLSDFRPGAKAIGPDGNIYTVTNVTDMTIHVKKTICKIQDDNGKEFSVPADNLTPYGKPIVKIAVQIANVTLIPGDTATFLTSGKTYKGYTLRNIMQGQNKLVINKENDTVSIHMADIVGISLVY